MNASLIRAIKDFVALFVNTQSWMRICKWRSFHRKT